MQYIDQKNGTYPGGGPTGCSTRGRSLRRGLERRRRRQRAGSLLCGQRGGGGAGCGGEEGASAEWGDATGGAGGARVLPRSHRPTQPFGGTEGHVATGTSRLSPDSTHFSPGRQPAGPTGPVGHPQPGAGSGAGGSNICLWHLAAAPTFTGRVAIKTPVEASPARRAAAVERKTAPGRGFLC